MLALAELSESIQFVADETQFDRAVSSSPMGVHMVFWSLQDSARAVASPCLSQASAGSAFSFWTTDPDAQR